MLAVVEAASKRLEAGGDVPADLYLNAADFFRVYSFSTYPNSRRSLSLARQSLRTFTHSSKNT
jgi:hypothetical protein